MLLVKICYRQGCISEIYCRTFCIKQFLGYVMSPTFNDHQTTMLNNLPDGDFSVSCDLPKRVEACK
ncbi:hypothetical protein JCM10003_2115 [Bacteroides pyogenes JCM 10003]|nr:hypothetical protein [Bacteroides pyogenes]GAE22502.1 hypothetical protein JCM10003_2115 [Bacteroides pyogenes JCM 10003]SUV35788.1 Uncharacterised protein [Bacteroides pyogenes]